jgi:hypothetical protein
MTDWASKAITAALDAHHPDPAEFERQMKLESRNYDEDVIYCRFVNSAGARGIAQLMPQFHPLDVACDPERALPYAANLMVSNLNVAHGDHVFALSYYNAGQGATTRGLAGTLPGWPYAETVKYVSIILQISLDEARRRLTGMPATVPIKLSEVLTKGRSRNGDPYVWGGKLPPSTDCSGFVSWCYNGQVPSFTDAIFDATQRVAVPAPGDIVLYNYYDADQPGVQFPHVALYLDDNTVLDNRSPEGVGVHPQLSRANHTRYYRRLAGVEVDTLSPIPDVPPVPLPTPAPADPRDAQIVTLKAQLDTALTLVGEAYNGDGSVRKALANIRGEIVSLESFLERSATKKGAA